MGNMKKIMLWGSIVLGVAFIALAVFYWLTPAGSLPSYLPGFEAASTHVHFKHGLAALIVGLLLFIYAWFRSGPQRSNTSESTPTTMQ